MRSTTPAAINIDKIVTDLILCTLYTVHRTPYTVHRTPYTLHQSIVIVFLKANEMSDFL